MGPDIYPLLRTSLPACRGTGSLLKASLCPSLWFWAISACACSSGSLDDLGAKPTKLKPETYPVTLLRSHTLQIALMPQSRVHLVFLCRHFIKRSTYDTY